LTTRGPRLVRELLGELHGTFVNGSAYPTTEDGFWQTGVKPVVKLTTREGYSLRLTENHRLPAVTHPHPKVQRFAWREVRDLRLGDRVLLHKHRGAAWQGLGTFDEGWLLGSLVGDGTFSAKLGADATTYLNAHLDYWGTSRNEMAA